jgi:peroxidase
MREHNRLVDVYSAQHPTWSSEELYQRARKTVGAELQAITFNEYLPALLGPAAPSPTGTQYNPNLKPAVFNEFAAVFERVGHSMLTPAFLRIQNDGQPAPGGSRSAHRRLQQPLQARHLQRPRAVFLKGLSVEVQEETDTRLVDDMRVALLDAIDIQRARDHGLPDYNTLRQAYGLPQCHLRSPASPPTRAPPGLAALYPNINTIDPLIGALAEDHLPGASVGPLVAAGLRTQFEHLRDGDRFWYERDPDFTPADLDILRNTRLADIIMRNTESPTSQSERLLRRPRADDASMDGDNFEPYPSVAETQNSELRNQKDAKSGARLCASAPRREIPFAIRISSLNRTLGIPIFHFFTQNHR